MSETKRVPSARWAINLFANATDAEDDALRVLRPGASFYIWETEDGMYDWSAIRDVRSRHLVGAALVSRGLS